MKILINLEKDPNSLLKGNPLALKGRKREQILSSKTIKKNPWKFHEIQL